jgi:hypothetical protein
MRSRDGNRREGFGMRLFHAVSRRRMAEIAYQVKKTAQEWRACRGNWPVAARIAVLRRPRPAIAKGAHHIPTAHAIHAEMSTEGCTEIVWRGRCTTRPRQLDVIALPLADQPRILPEAQSMPAPVPNSPTGFRHTKLSRFRRASLAAYSRPGGQSPLPHRVPPQWLRAAFRRTIAPGARGSRPTPCRAIGRQSCGLPRRNSGGGAKPRLRSPVLADLVSRHAKFGRGV